ncbi:MAG: hypothetical protein QM758_05705 [Armatimonas sp.]
MNSSQSLPPELDARWRELIMPIAPGILDSHEFSRQGMGQMVSRLKDFEVAPWIIQMRCTLTERLEAAHSPYLPIFALRCEAALVGIFLIHPEPESRKRFYMNLMKRFLQEALHPLIERAVATGDPRKRRDYQILVKIYRLCDSAEKLIVGGNWSDLAEDAYQYKRMNNPPEIKGVFELAVTCTRVAAIFLNPDFFVLPVLYHLIRELAQQHRWQLEGVEDSATDYTPMVAEAFLTPLEAECPPPDWLPYP